MKNLRRLVAASAFSVAVAGPVAADPDAGAYLAARMAIMDYDFALSTAYLDRALIDDPQNPVLLEWRTILDNVILPLEIVAPRMAGAKKRDRAMELLTLVGLDGFQDKRPSELSGGMRQRASLCRSIVHKPDVLIMDEPFGALDAFTREDLWQTMRDLRAAEPFTCVLITHDLRESVFLGDQVIVLSGRPARTQHVLDVDLPADRTIESLYTPKATDMLHVLRDQIRLAQGRDGGAH